MNRRALLKGGTTVAIVLGAAGCAGYEIVDSDKLEQQQNQSDDPESQFEEYESRIETLENNVENLTQERANLEARVEELTQQRDDLEEQVSTLEDEQATLEKQIEDLRAENREATINRYVTTYEDAVHIQELASSRYEAGIDSWESGKYGPASALWGTASGYYDSAGYTFRVLRDRTSGDASNIAEEAHLHCTNARDAMNWYSVAGNSIQAGNNRQARDQLDKGDSLLQTAEEYRVTATDDFEHTLRQGL